MSKKSIFRKSSLDILRSMLMPVLFSAVIIAMIIYGLRQTEASSSAEGLRILEDSIRRAVITAYAIEGRFPDNIAHIENNYGIFIDRTRYVVHYNPVAANIMPNIAVFELNTSS